MRDKMLQRHLNLTKYYQDNKITSVANKSILRDAHSRELTA